MANMSLDQKLGQMVQIETYYQSMTPDVDYMVRVLHAGSMIIYGKNMSKPPQLKAYIAAVQADTDLPLFITMDEEGGDVDRLGYQKFDPPLPSAQWLGATGNPQIAYQAGTTAAKELKALGINTDLAPVVDVQEVPNPIEGPRLFGSDPKTVDTYASEFLQGLNDNGVIGCLKHWPGIGSLTQDPHLVLPTMKQSLSELDSTEFAAFQGMLPQLNKKPGMIMVTHVLVPAIDPTLPSSLSPAVIGVLRNQLGYDGVIITDNLYMESISQKYNLGQAAVLAVEAGDDILANAWDSQSMEWVISALKSAMQNGAISQARIDQSVRRILTLKALNGMYINDLGSGSTTQSYQAGSADQPVANSPAVAALAADLPHMRTILP
jgi:beta-N-acetylhexosaminidase